MNSVAPPLAETPFYLTPFEAIGERFNLQWGEVREAYFSCTDSSEEALVLRVGGSTQILARTLDGELAISFDVHARLLSARGPAVSSLPGLAEGGPSAPVRLMDEQFSAELWARVDMLFWSLNLVWLEYLDSPTLDDGFVLPAGVPAQASELLLSGSWTQRIEQYRARSSL